MSVPAPARGAGQYIGWAASQTRRRRVRVYAHPPDGVAVRRMPIGNRYIVSDSDTPRWRTLGTDSGDAISTVRELSSLAFTWAFSYLPAKKIGIRVAAGKSVGKGCRTASHRLQEGCATAASKPRRGVREPSRWPHSRPSSRDGQLSGWLLSAPHFCG